MKGVDSMFYHNPKFYDTLSKTLVGLAILFALIGFFKVIFYGNPGMNSYVGGDAYNYIINAGYFAGCMSVSGSCLISALLSQGIALRLNGEKVDNGYEPNIDKEEPYKEQER